LEFFFKQYAGEKERKKWGGGGGLLLAKVDNETHNSMKSTPFISHRFTARSTCLAGAELTEVFGSFGNGIGVQQELDPA
jgi:hypothetical protein